MPSDNRKTAVVRVSEDEFWHTNWPQYDVKFSESFTEEDLAREYQERVSQLEAALSHFGERDQCGQADFGIQDDWGHLDRSFGLGLTSLKMFSEKLVPTLQAFIKSLPDPYLINVTPAQLGFPRFGMHIEHDKVTIWAENEDILENVLAVFGLGENESD